MAYNDSQFVLVVWDCDTREPLLCEVLQRSRFVKDKEGNLREVYHGNYVGTSKAMEKEALRCAASLTSISRSFVLSPGGCWCRCKPVASYHWCSTGCLTATEVLRTCWTPSSATST